MLNISKWISKYRTKANAQRLALTQDASSNGATTTTNEAVVAAPAPPGVTYSEEEIMDEEEKLLGTLFDQQHDYDNNAFEEETSRLIDLNNDNNKHDAIESTTFKPAATTTYGGVAAAAVEPSTPTSRKQQRKQQLAAAWKKIKTRTPYYVPVLKWLPNYSLRTDLFGDIISGVTLAIMIVPQSLAYALLAGLPPIYGLYTSWSPLIMYSIMGSSRQLSMGPESVVSILVGSTISSFGNDLDLEAKVACAGMLAFFVGLLLLILGLCRFGFLDNTLSRPILRGFISAIAIIIIVEQFEKLTGISLPPGHTTSFDKLRYLFENMHLLHTMTFFIGVSSVLMLLSFKILKKKFGNALIFKYLPGILVVVSLWILMTFALRLDKQGVKILGDITGGFPKPSFPLAKYYKYAKELIQPAAVIAIVGFVESVAVCKTYAQKHSYSISANRELVALGVSNIFGSFMKAYPAFGSLSRSSVGDMAGSKTQLSGFVVSICVLLTMLFLTKLFYFLPQVVMGAIITVAALGLIEFHDMYFLWKISAWRELFLMLFTAGFTFVFGVELGIAASIAISIFLVINHTTLPHISILGRIPGSNKLKDISIFQDAKVIEGILIIRVEESLYFANIGQVKEMFYRIERLGSASAHPSSTNVQPPLKAVVIDARNIPSMDATAIQVLREMVEDYHRRSIEVCFVRLRDSIRNSFLRAGIIQQVGVSHIFNKNHEALDFLEGRSTGATSSYWIPTTPITSSTTTTTMDHYSSSSSNSESGDGYQQQQQQRQTSSVVAFPAHIEIKTDYYYSYNKPAGATTPDITNDDNDDNMQSS